MLQITFPELESLCQIFSETMLQFLMKFPSARLIKAAKPGKFFLKMTIFAQIPPSQMIQISKMSIIFNKLF
jgi:hypothetical protein